MFLAFITFFLLAGNEAVLARIVYHHSHHHHPHQNHSHHHPYKNHSHYHGGKRQSQGKPRYKTITVDQSGHGDFSKIQDAINSVHSNNNHWIYIKVNAGTYREKLMIPEDKPYIILQGVEKESTFVEWDDHASSAQSSTFTTMANNIVVKNISFRNTFNDPKKGNPMTPAVAAMICGDKSSFFNVGFYSLQDTLWDCQGKHYFYSCTIEGAMDFIYGAGQSLYENCGISVLDAEPGKAVIGFITAQGRSNPEDPNGFVFKNCDIHGVGKAYLGRPWRPYARVLFYKTAMSSIIQPLGWQPWDSSTNVRDLKFSEVGNSGPGSSLAGRVNWLTKLDSATVMMMTSARFVSTDGWLRIHQRL